ncbi:MAG: hypothetical protein KDA44_07490 [Planctomycetales bacterium]|nr:hypothetical protein [Planctomycetales bacterium]
MAIAFSCPACQKKYQVKDALAGKSAKCACGHKIAIPATAAVGAATASAAKAAARPAAAQQAKPQPKPQRTPAAAPLAAVSSDMGSFLDEELAVDSSASAAPATCPACGGRIPGGGVLCIACGYDTRSGKKVATSPSGAGDKAKPGKSRVRAAAGATTSLATGTLLSAAGALVGALVWAGVAYFLEAEIGYIAWGLGGLAGLGMAVGHRGGGGTAGLIAAGMAIGGILAAKIFIVYFILGVFILEPEVIGLLFGPIDALFVLLAVGTAFRLGAAGSE